MPNVAKHRATLAVRSDGLDRKRSTPPDFIFYNDDDVQYSGWNLGTRTLEFDGAKGTPDWHDQRQCLIDLGSYNAGSTLRAPASPAAVVKLPAGDLLAGGDKDEFDVTQGGTTTARSVSISIAWKGDYLNLTATSGDALALLFEPDAVVTIANVAPEPDPDAALGHFVHYYSELFKNVKGDMITLKHRGVTVYDCVPSVALP